MPDVLAYVLGVFTGAALVLVIRRCTKIAAEKARDAAIIECRDRQRERTNAFNRGYARAREDYRNMSEVERFADTFEGRRVKLHVREA